MHKTFLAAAHEKKRGMCVKIISLVDQDSTVIPTLKKYVVTECLQTAVIRGTLLGLQYMGKDKGGKGGAIINMASICGIYTLPPIPMYTAAKHGVVALTRSLGVSANIHSIRNPDMQELFFDSN